MVSDATTPLPAELAQLFADGGAGWTLPVALPAGRLVRPRSPGGDTPAYWLSDQPAPATLWSRLRAAHSRSGLWPLLLEGLDNEPARPWLAGEVHPQPVGQIDHHDAARFLASVWSGWVRFVEEDYEPDFVVEALAPFGRDWPGLAPPGAPVGDPDVVADQCAAGLEDGQARLGLVAADRGADTLALSGWTGPANHAKTAPLAAVVRSWEDRFGVRVVRVGLPPVLERRCTPRHHRTCAAGRRRALGVLPRQHRAGLGRYAGGLCQADPWQEHVVVLVGLIQTTVPDPCGRDSRSRAIHP